MDGWINFLLWFELNESMSTGFYITIMAPQSFTLKRKIKIEQIKNNNCKKKNIRIKRDVKNIKKGYELDKTSKK